LSLIASKLLAPSSSSAAKRAPYESGIVPGKGNPERFPVRFYLIAMIFIVFDIEIICLYPWAVIYRDLGVPGLVEVTLFAVPAFVSYLYLIANGALDWGPVKRCVRPPPVATTALLAGTPVRRVGLQGRDIGHDEPQEVPA